MASFIGEQVCPLRISYIMIGMTGFNPAIDLLKIRNSAYTSNAGYALGNINRITDTSWTRYTINAAAALQWLKVYLGTATPEIIQRAALIRQEIAEAVADYVNSNNYSNDLGMTNFLLKDLDVHLIRDALIQRFDKPLTWQSESMRDINTLLDYNVFSGTTPYKFADLDTDGLVTNTQVTPQSSTDHGYKLFNATYTSFASLSWQNGLITNTSSSTHYIIYDRVNNGGGSVGSTQNGWYAFFNLQYQQPQGIDIIYYANGPTATEWQVTLGPGESIAIGNVVGTPQFPAIAANVGVEEITSFASQIDGDTDHWIRLSEEGWDPFITSRYRALKNYAHQQYHLFKPLIYSKAYMSSQRIRTCQLEYPTGVPNVDDLPVVAVTKTSFTTDFKYIRKDPNGQFLAGGMARCPAFAGQSSNGVIPDNPKLGFGYVMPCQASTSRSGAGIPDNIPYNWNSDWNYSDWYFQANVPEEIVVATPADLSQDSLGYLGTDHKLQIPSLSSAIVLECPVDMQYRSILRTSPTSGASQTLARFGNWSYETTSFGSGNVLSSNTHNYIWFNSNNNTLYIIPNMWNFVVRRILPDQTIQFYIPRGRIQVGIKNVYWGLINATVSGRASFNSVEELVQARLTAAGKQGESWKVAIDWQSSAVYAEIPPTNFDFLETD